MQVASFGHDGHGRHEADASERPLRTNEDHLLARLRTTPTSPCRRTTPNNFELRTTSRRLMRSPAAVTSARKSANTIRSARCTNSTFRSHWKYRSDQLRVPRVAQCPTATGICSGNVWLVVGRPWHPHALAPDYGVPHTPALPY
jgi:hypothetical protein